MAEDQYMHLVIVRHGESEWNKLNLFTGWTDVDLTETGHEEAAAGGRALKEAGYDFDVCYTSLLKRAIHTLNHVLDELDRNWLPVHKTWRLNERHYGALQGLNTADAAARRRARSSRSGNVPRCSSRGSSLHRVPEGHHCTRMALL